MAWIYSRCLPSVESSHARLIAHRANCSRAWLGSTKAEVAPGHARCHCNVGNPGGLVCDCGTASSATFHRFSACA
jgi:hypothetical protein